MKPKTIDKLLAAAGALDDAVYETHAKDCNVPGCPTCGAWDALTRAVAAARAEQKRAQEKLDRHAKALAESAAARD